MTIMKSTEIHHRDDFPLLCLMRNLNYIVEVGVDQGAYSEIFLRRHYLCEQYWGIDPYTSFPEMPFSRESSYLSASRRYSNFSNATLLKESSEEAARVFSKLQKDYGNAYRKFGFIYIDADHDYEAVKKNIREWWPLLAVEGILAGHDYDESHPGVIRAVNEFVDEFNLNLYLTWSDGDAPCHSWYVYKDKSVVPFRRVQP